MKASIELQGRSSSMPNVAIASALAKINEVFASMGQSDPHRQNGLPRYIGSTPAIFSALEGAGPVPSPMCVQMEITNTCSTL